MKTTKNLPPDLVTDVLDALLQLHREGDCEAINSVLAGLDECPESMAPVMISGLVAIATS